MIGAEDYAGYGIELWIILLNNKSSYVINDLAATNLFFLSYYVLVII